MKKNQFSYRCSMSREERQILMQPSIFRRNPKSAPPMPSAVTPPQKLLKPKYKPQPQKPITVEIREQMERVMREMEAANTPVWNRIW